MNIRWALFALVAPAFGQYAGPAILSRGEAPAAMATPQVSFRPYFETTGIYDTGLAAVAVNNQGDLANAAAPGVMAAWGVSGAKSWRRTRIGLNYRGSLRHYTKQTYYDSTEQTLLLGITHQLSRHAVLTFSENAGTYSRDYGIGTLLSQTVQFDPASNHVPKSDFFDNRTIYLSTQAGLAMQRSARMSLSFGGEGFLTRRRSTALAGVVGAVARGDVQYRLTRRSTIGGGYTFLHYDFNRIIGGSDIHGFQGSYSIRLSKTVEFSGYGGVSRLESKFVRLTPVDPVIAALLGIGSSAQVVHNISWVPTLGGRVSKAVPRGVIWVSGGRSISQGNGLFLTSESSHVMAGYTYTGLRRWSFSANSAYYSNISRGNIAGGYSNLTGSLSASRQIRRSTHVLVAVDTRSYGSGDYSKYNRNIYTVRVGIGFAPGAIPLRIW